MKNVIKYRISDGFVLGTHIQRDEPLPEIEGVAFTDVLPNDNFITRHFNAETKEYYDGATLEEKHPIALEIYNSYTPIISELLSKHIERKLIDGEEIPEDVLVERDRLKKECKDRLKSLGFENFKP